MEGGDQKRRAAGPTDPFGEGVERKFPILSPNVESIEDRDEAGRLVITIRALRRIRAGEELFLDYALDVGGEDPAEYPCRCGSTRCRGTLLALSTDEATAEG
jgi:SET domain-containing protein